MGTLSMQNHFYKLKNNAVMRRLSFSSLPESYYPSIAKMLQLHYIEVSNALAQLVDYYSYFLEMSRLDFGDMYAGVYIKELENYFSNVSYVRHIKKASHLIFFLCLRQGRY
jgi:hypothetical protein